MWKRFLHHFPLLFEKVLLHKHTHKSSASKMRTNWLYRDAAYESAEERRSFDLQEVLRDAASVQKAAQQPWRDGWGLRERESWQRTRCVCPALRSLMGWDLISLCMTFLLFARCQNIVYFSTKNRRARSVNVPEQALLELIFHSNDTQRPRMWGADDVWL